MSDPRSHRPYWNPPTIDPGRRRAVLGLAASLAVPGVLRGQAERECAPTRDSGEGPFYFDPDLVRSDITAGREGAPLDVAIDVLRAGDCATLADARFDLWHADAIGLYSGYDSQPGTGDPSPSVADATFLRGTQFTDAEGRVRFRTVYPSWYRGRTPHLHFKVFVGGDEVVASQLFMPEEFNEEVFADFEPYRSRVDRRETFNSNDRFLTGTTGGAFCEVERRGDGYAATATVIVRG